MSVENSSFYYIQDIIDKEFRDAFRVRMTPEEEEIYPSRLDTQYGDSSSGG